MGVMTVWSTQCIQHCTRHAACLHLAIHSFPASPALYLLGTLLLKQTAAFFCPWVWSHWLLLFSQSPKRQPLPVAEAALGPMW